MKSSTTITIRMPSRVRDAIYSRAEAARTSASDWCREVLRKALEQVEEQDRLQALERRIISRIDRLELEIVEAEAEGEAAE